jgi:hypothetical protein
MIAFCIQQLLVLVFEELMVLLPQREQRQQQQPQEPQQEQQQALS